MEKITADRIMKLRAEGNNKEADRLIRQFREETKRIIEVERKKQHTIELKKRIRLRVCTNISCDCINPAAKGHKLCKKCLKRFREQNRKKRKATESDSPEGRIWGFEGAEKAEFSAKNRKLFK